MAKKVLNAEVAGELATLAVNGQLSTLVVDKYKSGKNKGKHFADYTEGERTLPLDSINVLNTIALGLKEGKEYDIEIQMPADQRMYVSVAGR